LRLFSVARLTGFLAATPHLRSPVRDAVLGMS